MGNGRASKLFWCNIAKLVFKLRDVTFLMSNSCSAGSDHVAGLLSRPGIRHYKYVNVGDIGVHYCPMSRSAVLHTRSFWGCSFRAIVVVCTAAGWVSSIGVGRGIFILNLLDLLHFLQYLSHLWDCEVQRMVPSTVYWQDLAWWKGLAMLLKVVDKDTSSRLKLLVLDWLHAQN